MEESGASCAQPQTCQVRLPRVTGNTPAPTAVKNNSAALAPVSVNIIGGQGTMPPSRQAMAATTKYFVYKRASTAQEHVERNAAVKAAVNTILFRSPFFAFCTPKSRPLQA